MSNLADYWSRPSAEQQQLFEEAQAKPDVVRGIAVARVAPPVPQNPCLALYGPGPEGKQCKDCAHLRYPLRQRTIHWKCDLRELSHSATTDHRVRWPACARYEDRTEVYNGG